MTSTPQDGPSILDQMREAARSMFESAGRRPTRIVVPASLADQLRAAGMSPKKTELGTFWGVDPTTGAEVYTND